MDDNSTTAPNGATTFATKAPTPFAMCLAAFVAAKGAYQSHRDQYLPADADDHEGNRAYEHSYEPLVDAMNEAGVAAVLCPASSVAELAEKLAIFKDEDMANYEATNDLLDALIADALRIGGAA